MSINATLIGQMITFALLVWFTMKYVWPPLLKSLEDRKQKIADGLAAAEKGQHELELAEKRASGVLREAKAESADIVGLAQKRANEIVEESKRSAREEGDRLLVAARAQIDQEMQHAREDLRDEVSALALSAAEKILAAEIDQSKHSALLSDVTQKLS
ncbi:MAG: F0F1 ATP synthase subunit B [Methylococcales bacterium]|nr:F0F1 ATP synthase subunit B [Methylococcales bacterium]